jgi:cyclophilin family peptidyl-prolyl cis-trans isomerase
MNALMSTLFFFSVLMPTKLWFAPDQPVTVRVKANEPVNLVLVDFLGRVIDTQQQTNVTEEKDVDLRQVFPAMSPGTTYVLYAVPAGKALPTFVGTPLVVQMRRDKRLGAQPGLIAVRVEPLRYLKMSTDKGDMEIAFYYDAAPNTVNNFFNLADGGYFNDQVFHRIIPGFVIQGGDPLGTDPKRGGTGGPGYMIDAEFNDRRHNKGVLSMARQGDPLESQGMPPRSDAANSASSQFFICLDYARTKALDGKYTAFGEVVTGMETVDALAAVPTGPNDRPNDPPKIKSAKVVPVLPGENPYAKLLRSE